MKVPDTIIPACKNSQKARQAPLSPGLRRSTDNDLSKSDFIDKIIAARKDNPVNEETINEHE